METRCENCEELVEEIGDPDPSLSSDELSSDDLLFGSISQFAELGV